MREILFKAKRKSDGKWVEGYLVPISYDTRPTGYEIINKDGINYDELDYYQPNFVSEMVEHETISQYIGLCDKNGKKIFENDIVTSGSDSTGRKYYSAVYYDEFNCTCCNGVYGWTFVEGYGDIREYKDYEVVGNVFDNYELLEQPEENNKVCEPYVEVDTKCDLCKYKYECESKIEVTTKNDTRQHFVRWFAETCKAEEGVD